MEALPMPPALDRVCISNPFWDERLRLNRERTLEHAWRQLEETGRLVATRSTWDPDTPVPDGLHVFWGSDIAKWLEAAAYVLTAHPDPDLATRCDDLIEAFAKTQAEDGYLNLYFRQRRQEDRWRCELHDHELYSAGHLIEAAVAYHAATGKGRFLEVVSRYADLISETFGPADSQRRGYPGHEELELALVKLYRATGETRYLELAKFFVDERGRDGGRFFREEDCPRHDHAGCDPRYVQAHRPVREQDVAVGHAVRACYLYAGMIDVAVATGDTELLAAAKRLWENIASTQVYITGGVGAAHHRECFTVPYDLPNDHAYAETCAGIGLVFLCRRLLQAGPRARYADLMETTLYNNVLAGISLDGTRFFYQNRLEVEPRSLADNPDLRSHAPFRQEWFGCACCPPNLLRLLASLGAYAWDVSPRGVRVHLYLGGELTAGDLHLRMATAYPWRETVTFTVLSAPAGTRQLSLRLPGWCRAPYLKINGADADVTSVTVDGYAVIDRVWSVGDSVELAFPMPVEHLRAHPRVRHDGGQVALRRGPLVYCLEEIDNGPDLGEICLDDGPWTAEWHEDLMGGVVLLRGTGLRTAADWGDDLYLPDERVGSRRVDLTAVPYAYWGNRADGEMRVWLHQGLRGTTSSAGTSDRSDRASAAAP